MPSQLDESGISVVSQADFEAASLHVKDNYFI